MCDPVSRSALDPRCLFGWLIGLGGGGHARRIDISRMARDSIHDSNNYTGRAGVVEWPCKQSSKLAPQIRRILRVSQYYGPQDIWGACPYNFRNLPPKPISLLGAPDGSSNFAFCGANYLAV